jgi:hypothetical protein
MPGPEHFSQQPLFFLLALISALLTVGYYWGNQRNRKLFEAVYDEMTQVIKPEQKEHGNIGGSREYYCNYSLKKDGPIDHIEAKFAFLPRHLLPYLPISLLIDKYDKLLLAFHYREKLHEEGHLIEARYAQTRKARIAGIEDINKAFIKWGNSNFNIYYRNKKTLERFKRFVERTGDPGVVRHIAIVPDQKKCFVFMIPRKGKVIKELPQIYQLLLTLE